MTKTITFNDLRRLNDFFSDGCAHRLHIEPGPDGGIVVLDDTTIYDKAIAILEEEEKKKEA